MTDTPTASIAGPAVGAVDQVEVHTQPDGSLLVAWDVEGEPVRVDVSVGPGPDLVDHRHHTTVPAGTRTLQLANVGSGRHFVSVSPTGGGPAVVAADRRVPFEGVANFRDLGGYRAGGGGRVRWGRLFRADSLHALSVADLVAFGDLGLKVVYDLREDTEREERPDPIPARAHTIVGRPAGTDARSSVPAGLTAGDGARFLEDLYVGLIDHSAARIGELYTGLVRPGGLPAVFHCHAGKDRTGIVAALLLEALGVSRDTILDDYELTSRYRLRSQQDSSLDLLIQVGMSPEAAAAVLETPRSAMSNALDHLDVRYGGIGPYLTGPARMSGPDLTALRSALVSAD